MMSLSASIGRESSSRDIYRIAGFAFAVAGIAVLVASLNQPIEYDEAITVLIAGGNGAIAWPKGISDAAAVQMLIGKSSSISDVLTGIRDTDVHPPLYYLCIWLIQSISGANVLVDRAVSLAMVVIGLFPWLSVWRRHIDDSPGSSALFAAVYFSMFGVFYMATTARGYALTAMLLSFSFAALLRQLRSAPANATKLSTERSGAAIAFVIGLTAGLAVCANYLAAFAAVFIAGTALIVSASRRNWPQIAYLAIGAALPIAVAAYFFLHQYGQRPEQYSGFIGVFELLGRLFTRMLFYIPTERAPRLEQMVVVALLLAFPMLGCLQTVIRRASGHRVVVLAAGIVVAHLAGLVLLSAVSDKTLDETRYTALTAPFLAAFLTLGLTHIVRAGGTTKTLAALPFALIAAQLFLTGTVRSRGSVEEWTKIATRAAATAPNETLLVIDRGYGRGVPAAVVLSASPGTRILIAGLHDLTNSKILTRTAEYRHVHVALSYKSRIDGNSHLLDRYFSSLGYRTKTKTRYYRHFAR